jgi:hypothetical protein
MRDILISPLAYVHEVGKAGIGKIVNLIKYREVLKA